MIEAGLVLEGGATRGVFTSGALDYLMEREIYLSHVVGVSAGSCNAVDYLSRQPGRTRDCMIHRGKEYNYYYGLKDFVKERSLLDMDMIFDKYPNEVFPFDFETYFASDMRCEIVVTNCETGEAEYLTEEKDPVRLMKLCRASSSMPLVCPVVKIDGRPYLDGGLADSVPVRHIIETGPEKTVVILTRPRGYRKKPVSKSTAGLYRTLYKNYPALVETCIRRNEKYNEEMAYIEALEEEGRIYVLRPHMRPVSRLEKDFEKLLAFYHHGYRMMELKYRSLTEYLKK